MNIDNQCEPEPSFIFSSAIRVLQLGITASSHPWLPEQEIIHLPTTPVIDTEVCNHLYIELDMCS